MIYIQNLKLSIPSKIVLIGASSGGPGQIEKIIKALPKLNNTSIIIAQHMAVGFMNSFAKRLQENSVNIVSVANNDSSLESGHIYACCGDIKIYKEKSKLYFSKKSLVVYKFNPDINILFNSFTPFADDIEILSVILTGIGDDGVQACSALSLKGSSCITESEESAIVDGMPSRARSEVQNIKVFDMDKIIIEIKEFCN